MDDTLSKQLTELTNTSFFRLISRLDCFKSNEEKELSAAYIEFVSSVTRKCLNFSDATVYFSLSYVRTELLSLQKENEKDGERSKYVDSYIIKGLSTVDCGLEWMQIQKNATPVPQAFSDDENEPLMSWTGKLVELIELAMSVHESRSINDGEVSIKSVVYFFCKIFDVKPGNIFSAYSVMRSRAGSRTLYLDRLKSYLEQKMDKDDEKEEKRKK